MQKDFAVRARDLTLEALRKLQAVAVLEADWGSPDMQDLRRALGIFIGSIDVEILCAIYRHFPELDDLPDEAGHAHPPEP